MAKKKLSAIELILKKLAKLFEVSLAGKQDVLSFNTSYDASTNKAATMSDMPSVMGASGSGHASGLVPDPGATAGTDKYLREDGTWQIPASGSDISIAATGSSTKPVYVSATNTFSECSLYAGGTAVTLNGTNKGASTASFYAPTAGGTSGQYLMSNGSGEPTWASITGSTNIAAVGSSTKPVYVSAKNTFTACSTYAGGTKVTLNGTDKGASTASFYAPTAVGTSGQILKSNGSGAPTWGNFVAAGSATKPVYLSANNTFSECSKYAGGTAVTLNGTAKDSSTASFYAPTDAGISGRFLKSNGSGAPTWANFATATGSGNMPVYISATNTFSDCSLYAGGSKVTLNGTVKAAADASFYAPTSAGTSGQFLKSNGSGKAPIWANFVSATGSGNMPVYISATNTFSDCSLYAGGTAVTLNGTDKGASTASFYAPTAVGTSGQYLKSNGSGKAPTWTTLTFASETGSSIKPVYISATNTFTACSKYAGGTAVTLNGTVLAAADASFYAPTKAGTSGQYLKSNGSGSAPTWTNFVSAKGNGNMPVYISGTDTFSDCSLYAGGTKVTLNGVVLAAADASFYAPTKAGTSGYYLKSNGSGSAPTWTSITFASVTGSSTKPVYVSATNTFSECSLYAGGTAVTLNGTAKDASTASFYAPTKAGTSGQFLKSSGSGTAPTWTNFATATGSDNKPVYISGTDTFSVCSKYAGGTAVTLNGTVKAAADASFYAPTSAGTDGQYLMSNGSGSAPTWTTISFPGQEKMSVSAITAANVPSTLTFNTFYRITDSVGTKTFTLPAPSSSYAGMIMIHFKTSTSTSITISSSKTVKYCSTYSITTSKTYLLTCIWNGNLWMIVSDIIN